MNISWNFFGSTSRLLISFLSADDQDGINMLLFFVLRAEGNVTVPVVQESKVKRNSPSMISWCFFDHSTANYEIEAKLTNSKRGICLFKLGKNMTFFSRPFSWPVLEVRRRVLPVLSPWICYWISKALWTVFLTKTSSPRLIRKQMRMAAIHVRHEHLQEECLCTCLS